MRHYKPISSYTDPDTGDVDVMDWRAALRRQLLPYGYAVLDDGRHVLFNRRYRPLYIMTDLFEGWRRVSRSTPIGIGTARHVSYFYNAVDTQTLRKAMDALRSRELPVPDRSALTYTRHSTATVHNPVDGVHTPA